MNGGLPKGWDSIILGQLFDFKYGKGLPQEKRNSKGSINVYGSNGIVGVHDNAVTKGITIIIGRKGSVGEIHLSPKSCWPIDTTYYIDEFHASIPPVYWMQYLRSLKLDQQEKSSAIPGISRVDIYSMEVPVPPLTEQRRIEAKLEVVIGKVDACQKRLAKVPVLLKRFRQSVLAAACSGRLTKDWRTNNNTEDDLSYSWKKVSLSEICELITKGASPKWQGVNYSSRGILFITSENVGSGKLLLDNMKYVEPKINVIQPRSILRKGDLLTNIVGASIGRSAIFDLNESANINQAVALIRLKNDIDRNYILFVLNSPDIIDHMNLEKVDVARANLSLKDVSEFPILLPPSLEQKEIVLRVKELFALADQIEERYKKAKARVDRLTQSILAKAFRGELVPQDPNDEPASMLLERIRAEREEEKKEPNKRQSRK